MARVKPFSARRMAVAACVLSLTSMIGVIPWRMVAQEANAGQAAAGGAGTEKEAPTNLIGE